jgi:hypothetical protein
MTFLATLRAGATALGIVMLIACGAGDTASANGSAAAPRTIADSPTRTALAEFDRVCGRVADRDADVAAAPAAGWTAFDPPAESPVGRILALGRRMVREAAEETGELGPLRYENAAFRKTAGGRELVLLVSLIDLPEQQSSTECRLFDVEGTAPTDAEISAWTAAPPSNRMREQGVTAFEWQPGFRPGFSRIAIIHVDPSSPARAQIPVVGLGIMSIQGPPAA